MSIQNMISQSSLQFECFVASVAENVDLFVVICKKFVDFRIFSTVEDSYAAFFAPVFFSQMIIHAALLATGKFLFTERTFIRELP